MRPFRALNHKHLHLGQRPRYSYSGEKGAGEKGAALGFI